MPHSHSQKSKDASSAAVANLQNSHGSGISLPSVAIQKTGLDGSIQVANGVIQARWDNVSAHFLKWTPPKDGRTWWYRVSDSKMTHTKPDIEELSLSMADTLVWKSHRQWQTEYITSINVDRREPTPALTFDELAEKGENRWNAMVTLMERGGGMLDEDTQQARDWFYKEYYTREVEKTDRDWDQSPFAVRANYNAQPQDPLYKSTHTAVGQYTGEMDVHGGSMKMANTYALGGPGEMYYNPRSRMEERMPTSEILYQQWREARKGLRENPKLKVKEETVAGDGVDMINVIKAKFNEMYHGIMDFTTVSFSPADKPPSFFYAMLAVPNVTASIFLIRDHGRELGITTIERIVVPPNKHIAVHFK